MARSSVTACALCLVLALSIVGCARQQSPNGNHDLGKQAGPTKIGVKLAGNPCTPDLTAASTAHAVRAAVVIWEITNNCDTDQVFKVDFKTDANNPFEHGPSFDRAVPKSTGRSLPAVVRGDAASNSYKYDVYLSGVLKVDPRIVID